MRKLIYALLVCAVSFFSNNAIAQNYELKLTNFEQVSEYELKFDLEIKNTRGTPWAYNSGYFAIGFNPDLMNSGQFVNDYLTVDNTSSDLTAEQKLGDGDFFFSIPNTALQTNAKLTSTGTPVMLLDDSQPRTIATFLVKLRNGSGFLNFGSVDASLAFIVAINQVFECQYYMDGSIAKRGAAPGVFGPTTLLSANPSDYVLDVPDRQIAGFWYYGDGDWDEVANWNSVLKLANSGYVQTLPGPNANAIINGNVTVTTDESMLPDLTKVGGNGGELTVLNGPIKSTLTITNGDAASVRYRIPPVTGTWSAWALSHSVGNLEPGVVVQVQANTFDDIIWQSNAGGSFNTPNSNPTIYTMPANDVTISPVNAKSATEMFVNREINVLNASLTISPGASLTVDQLYNDNTNGAAAIVVKSDATGTGYLIHNNEGVEATVERFLSVGKYHYVSSPVEDAPYSIFQVWPAPAPPAFADFWAWEETTREWTNLNYNLPVGILEPGKGYAVAYSDMDYTKEFVGPLNVGNVTFDATYTPGASSPFWNQRGFNLTGNPYAAALDADALLTAHPDIYGLYFWDEAADYEGDRNDYATYSLLGGVGTAPAVGGGNQNDPSGFIAPGQGFMVQVKSTPFNVDATKTITYTNAMRVLDEAYFYKEQEDRNRIWLSVTGPQMDYNKILVGFMEGAEVGMDRTDAEKIKGNEKLAFYSILDGVEFAIQGFPMIAVEDTYEISLGVDAGFAGQYTFNADMIENFDPSINITFEDRLASKIINLRTTPEYVAQIAEPGEIRNRFFLHFNGPTSVPVIDQKLTKVYALQNQIIIQNVGNSQIFDVEVVNTLGQSILRTPVYATEAAITVPGRNVVYIVKVRTSEGIESHKLLIR